MAAKELASRPKEGLLEVVVGIDGDVAFLQVFLALESDSLGLDLSLQNNTARGSKIQRLSFVNLDKAVSERGDRSSSLA